MNALFRISTAFFFTFFIGACSTPKSVPSEQVENSGLSSDNAQAPFQKLLSDPRAPTEIEAARAKKAALIYQYSLSNAIKKLDDKVSDAKTIALAALSQCMPQLRERVRTQTAHINNTEFERDNLEGFLAKLPTQFHISEATSAVLKNRKSEELKTKREEWLKRGRENY